MRAYYAHCQSIYSTPQEDWDVELIENLGFDVINPNSPEINAECNDIKRRWKECAFVPTQPEQPNLLGYKDASEAIMVTVFKPIAEEADVVFFRALPDGRISAGVAQEIAWARAHGVAIVELPSGLHRRVISVDETREYLREIGQR